MKLFSVVLTILALLAGLVVLSCHQSEQVRVISVPSGVFVVEGSPAKADGRVTVTAARTQGRQIGITINNGMDDDVMLRRELRVEQLGDDDDWREMEGVGDIWIRTKCALRPGAVLPEGPGDYCFGLTGRTQIDVIPWLGTFGDAQCSCVSCTPVPPGTYRIVAYGCDGQRYESGPVRDVNRSDRADMP